MNQVFSALLNERIERLKYSFKSSRDIFADPETGNLFHKGEFGTYREKLLCDFLKLCVPARLGISTGFLINSTGDTSTQTDIVIYDKSTSPRIESKEHQNFFPVESICAIGEAKSKLSKQGLKDALNKLARVKSKCDRLSSTIPVFRDESISHKPFDRENEKYDQVVSFLICEKFDFDFSTIQNEITTWYEDDIEDYHKHNLVLSIEDGLLCYVDNNKKSWMYPSSKIWPAKNTFLTPNDNENLHFYIFCSYLNLLATSATILYPEMIHYMPSVSGGTRYDEQ